MSVQLHTHQIRPRFTRLLAAMVTAGGIATAVFTTGMVAQMISQASRSVGVSMRRLTSVAKKPRISAIQSRQK